MKTSGMFYWLFIICFAIQFLFSRDWLSFGENTLLFALIPLIGAVAALFHKGATEQMPGKIVITIIVAFGCMATLNSAYISDSVKESWGIWLYVMALTGLLWEVMGIWSRVETGLNKKTGLAINILVPFLFGGMLLYLWEMFTVGFEIPLVLLPA